MRWIVDGMNVIGSRPDGWWKDRRGAMAGLVERLERWAAAGGHRVTVVFEEPPVPPIESAVVEVGHAPRAGANSADDEIVRLVEAAALPAEITVVTSDSGLAARIRDTGAAVQSATGFRDVIERFGH
ncbi:MULTISPECIES: NYN domain-containing protein [Mycolicibacterium]|uniref:RNA-binding protein n=3 Tax=Mycolicibacterium TaxID=1866885 RepID=A0ABR5FQY0_9MYCO|nr:MULTISPECIES: NYN domain-containing protein [Mycolicibacterium]KLI05307.1 RNA-binding protein [Mycolicibacterium senegalense]KLO50341.1 RNA-binding protein [Mycolicibacterium senegalense]KMV19181.1 RNA-binding protein [Mycolicibacterium conceptionense]MCV7338103.1 NYN domain-containing protein [Mycolicibacterium senegalense]MDR7290172.1 putative RNA-binding protein with PIN domain [Mycolicibacterium senegalense]